MDVETQGAVTVLEPSRPPALSSTVANTFDATLALITRAAADPAVNVDKMNALLSMQERIMSKQAEIAFNAALVNLNNSGVLRVKKEGTVKLPGKGEYAFARWEDMDKVLRPLLNANGMWLSFDTKDREGGGVVVIATLKHADGHQQTATMWMPVDTGPGRNNLQAIGSSLSYGKRYTTELLLNIVRENADDDGHSGADIRLIAFEDAKVLDDLLIETGFDRAQFFRQFNVRATIDIREVDFKAALQLLQNAKRRLMAERAAQNTANARPPQDQPPQTEPAPPPPTQEQQPPQQPSQERQQPPARQAVEDSRYPAYEKMSPDEQKAHDKRTANAPKVLQNFLNLVAGARYRHDLESQFGALDGRAGVQANLSNISWMRWMRHYEPDMFKQFTDAVDAKIKTIN